MLFVLFNPQNLINTRFFFSCTNLSIKHSFCNLYSTFCEEEEHDGDVMKGFKISANLTVTGYIMLLEEVCYLIQYSFAKSIF